MGATPELVRAFKQDHALFCLSRAKVALVLGVLIFPAFAALDFIVAPELFQTFLLLRLMTAVAGLLILLLLSLSRAWGRKLCNLLLLIYVLSIQWVISYMCFRLGGFNSPYYAGIIVVVLGIGLIMPWHPFYMITLNLLTYASYLSQAFWLGMNAPLPIFVNNNFFLACAFFLTAVGAALQYRLYFRLKEKDQHKADFFHNISHELKTPLTLVVSPLQQVLEREALPDSVRPELQMALKNSRALFSLILTLLDTAKLEAGMIELKIEPLDPVALAKEVLNTFQPLLQEKRLKASFVEKGPVPKIYADRQRVQSIFTNLYSNAIKFSDKKETSLETTFEVNKENLLVKIKDYGIGIPRQELKKVFERFFQLDAGLTRSYGGTGIGLSYVRDLIQAHQGRIEVDSKEGAWTEFRFTLPLGEKWLGRVRHLRLADDRTFPEFLAVGPEGESLQGLLQATPLPQSAKGSILIVDDNADLLQHMSHWLSSRYQVYLGRDGVEGVEAAQRYHPDLILTDLMMPRKDGLQLIREVRADPGLRDIPIVVLTAHGDEEQTLLRAFSAGVNDYLTKPFTPRELEARVENLIRLKKQQETISLQKEELQQANRVLKELSDFKSQLMAIVSHDLRGPLSVVRDCFFLMRTEALPQLLDKQKTLFQLGEKSIERMLGLINGLLDCNRLESGGIKLSLRRYNLADLVKDSLDSLKVEAERKKIQLDFNGAEGFVTMDPNRIAQVVDNLMRNAIRYSPEEGRIAVSLEQREGGLICSVQDEGPGIALEIQSRLFDQFVKFGDRAGWGLGLFISKKFVELHGGKIWVESHPGEGAKFLFTLPARIDTA